MNVLVTSAAAKVLLVRAFQQAARPLGGQVVAGDCDPLSAALHVADRAVLLPRTRDPAFGGLLLDFCRSAGIGLVVPTSDAELPVLAELAPGLAAQGIRLLVASPQAVAVCRDKHRFADHCRSTGFPVPRVWRAGETPDGEVLVRPATGAGGGGMRRLDPRGFATHPPAADEIAQEFIDWPEYSVDVLMDLEGRPLQAVTRRRIAVRAGEATKSRVEDLPALAEAALALCASLRLVGHNVVQTFLGPAGEILFIEINPRFGGASNLSIQAGLDSPARLLAMAAGRPDPGPRPIRIGLTMLRHAQDVFIEPAQADLVERLA